MRSRTVIAAITALWLCGALSAHAREPRITVTGSNVLTFRMNSISGGGAAQQAFMYGNYERQRQFENNASINITGILLPRLTANLSLNSSRYSPDRSRYRLAYDGNGVDFEVGDINAALQGNEFAPFSKSLLGIKTKFTIGTLDITTLLSEERAKVTTDVFNGTNTAGPYMLRYSPVVDGTQQIRVDGQPKVFGKDYQLDFNTGMLWFQGIDDVTHQQTSTIIPATSVIEASYEYAGWGNNPGTLVGTRAQLPLGKLGIVGATFISQMSRLGDGPSSNMRTDLWVGSNSAMVITLRYRPVKKIVSIKVDGIAQVENVDYTVQSLDAGTIVFQKVVQAPPGLPGEAPANVVIEYEIVDTQTTSSVGDRSIIGLDSTLNFGKSTVSLQFGRSGGGAERAGNAFSIRGNSEIGRFSFGFGLRDVGQKFTAIESVGFQQKESALDGNVEYRATDHMRFSARLNSSTRPSSGYYSPYSSYSGGTTNTTTPAATGGNIKALQSSFNIVMDYPKLPGLEIGHQAFSTSGSTVNSDSATSTINLRYALGTAINLGANVQHQRNQDRGSLGTSAESLTERFNLSYTPGTRFQAQLDFTNSSVKSQMPSSTGTGQTTGDAAAVTLVSSSSSPKQANLSLTYEPIKRVTLTTSYRVSDSGGGTYGGMGNSYYMSPYTSGSYMSSGNYGFGDQYTGQYYGSGSGSNYGSNSLYGTGTNTSYSSNLFPNTVPGSSSTIVRARMLRHRQTTGDDTTDTGTDTTDTTDTTTNANTNTRIRSVVRSVGLQWNPLDRLNLRAEYMHNLEEGQFTSSNSVSTTSTFGFTYTPWDALTLNGNVMRQNYDFMGDGGSSGSDIAFLDANLDWRKFTFHMNFQTMKSATGLPSLTGTGGYTGYGGYGGYGDTTGTGTTGTDLTGATTGSSSYATRMNTLTGRVERALTKKYKLFTELQIAKVNGGGSYGLSGGPENSNKFTTALGLEIGLGNNLAWSMDVRRLSYKDRNNPTRNYQGNMVTGEMKVNFW